MTALTDDSRVTEIDGGYQVESPSWKKPVNVFPCGMGWAVYLNHATVRDRVEEDGLAWRATLDEAIGWALQ